MRKNAVRFRVRRQSGFSLIEVMVAAGIVSVILLSLASFSNLFSKQQLQTNTTASADMVRRNLLAYLENSTAWKNTVNDTGNTTLDCLRNNTSCNGRSGSFRIRDAANNIVYDPGNPSAGFTSAGASCGSYSAAGNDACPLRFDLNWQPICAGSCIAPQIRIQGIAASRVATQNRRIAFNSNNYSFEIVREGSSASTCSNGAWYWVAGRPNYQWGSFVCPNNGVMKGFRSAWCDPDRSPSDYCFQVYCCDS